MSTWIAIPLAGLTACSTFIGGLVALRVRKDLTALIALTGGVVVAVALFDVLPEAIDAVGNSRQVTWLVGAGFLGFFLAERALVLHHRDDAEHAQAHPHIGMLGASALSRAQLHRRAWDRACVSAELRDGAARVRRRDLA